VECGSGYKRPNFIDDYDDDDIVTCISVAREQLGKHVPVQKNS
jgi:hypothetical protein